MERVAYLVCRASYFFFSSRRRHTRSLRDWSSDVCSSDLCRLREATAVRQSDAMEVVLANPRGFCAGVERAIEIVERALELHGAPIYVRHEIVHNNFVVDRLRAKGAVFVEELDEVPAGGTVIFSAHGVAKAVQAEADRRGLKIFDATCPLVSKVH